MYCTIQHLRHPHKRHSNWWTYGPRVVPEPTWSRHRSRWWLPLCCKIQSLGFAHRWLQDACLLVVPVRWLHRVQITFTPTGGGMCFLSANCTGDWKVQCSLSCRNHNTLDDTLTANTMLHMNKRIKPQILSTRLRSLLSYDLLVSKVQRNIRVREN